MRYIIEHGHSSITVSQKSCLNILYHGKTLLSPVVAEVAVLTTGVISNARNVTT